MILFSGYFRNLFKEEAPYQLSYSYSYSDKRATQELNIPYYVNEKTFDRNIVSDKNKFFEIERQIETEYLDDLRTRCTQAN